VEARTSLVASATSVAGTFTSQWDNVTYIRHQVRDGGYWAAICLD